MAYHHFEIFYENVQKIHLSWSEKMIIDLTISKIQIEISRNLEIGSDRKIGFSSKWTILGTSRNVLEPPFSTKLIDFQNFICMNTSKQSIGHENNDLNQLLQSNENRINLGEDFNVNKSSPKYQSCHQQKPSPISATNIVLKMVAKTSQLLHIKYLW